MQIRRVTASARFLRARSSLYDIFPPNISPEKTKITSPIIFHFTGDVTHFYFQFPFSDNLYFPTDESGFSTRNSIRILSQNSIRLLFPELYPDLLPELYPASLSGTQSGFSTRTLSGFSTRTLSGRESAHIYNECEKTHELHRQDDGDTQNEFGMPGLMTEGVHRNQSTDTATECCHQHKRIFRDSPLALDGKILISPVHNECKEIYNQQVYDEDCEWAK